MKKIKLKYSVDGQIGKTLSKFKKVSTKKAWINFKNLLPEDIEEIKKIAKPLMRERDGVTEISFSTDKPSTWDSPYTKPIVETLEYLENSGHYTMPSINDIMMDLKFALQDAVSQEDMKKATKTTDEMWVDFMKRLKDPDVQALIKSISPYYMGDSAYGWKMALSNAMRIKKEIPYATFVKTRYQWFREYNRTINPNSPKVLILVPLDSEVHDRGSVMRQLGHKDNVKFGDLSTQQKDAVMVNSRSGNAAHYTWKYVYDVSNTTVIDGEDDIFNETVGFVNNLTGELNDKAVKDQMSKGFDSKEAVDKLYKNENGDVVLLTKSLYRGITNKFPDIYVSIPKDNYPVKDFEYAFCDMVDKVSDRLIEEKGKIVRAENRKEGVKFVLTAILILTRLNPSAVAKTIGSSDFSPNYYYELREIINDIVDLINKNMPRQESKQICNEMKVPYIQNIDQLFDILHIDGEAVLNKEKTEEKIHEVKNNFKNILNKINKNG